MGVGAAPSAAALTALGYLRWHDVKAMRLDQVVRASINPPEKTEFLLTGDPDKTLMSAQLETSKNKIEVKSVRPLFHANFANEFAVKAGPYEVTADGTRFLINVDSDDPDPPSTRVLNWTALLNRK